jgi:tetratricopeptide (TPR) repeat protein
LLTSKPELSMIMGQAVLQVAAPLLLFFTGGTANPDAYIDLHQLRNIKTERTCSEIAVGAPDNSAVTGQQYVSDLVAAARAAARQDRNAESAALFARAIGANPGSSGYLLREYADQQTYSGHPDQAIGSYSAYLAQPDVSPQDRLAARKGQALALSWNGQLPAALSAYDALIQDQADDLGLRLDRARVLSWMARHEDAKAQYQQVLATDPQNAAAAEGLARADSAMGQHRTALAALDTLKSSDNQTDEALFLRARTMTWLGRPDLANPILSTLLERNPAHHDAHALRADIEHDQRPLTSVTAERSGQSNSLDITTVRLGQSFFWNMGTLEFGPDFEHQSLEPNNGGSVRISRLGLHLRNRFADDAQISLRLQNQRTNGPGPDKSLAIGEAYLTLWPNDAVRLDLGASRSSFDSIIGANYHANYGSASVDWYPQPRTRLTARTTYGDYSDGNKRWFGQIEAEQQLLRSPNLFLGARITHFSFDKTFDHGYFNPKSLTSAEATAHVWGKAQGVFWYDLAGSVGHEDASPGGGKMVYSASARLSRALSQAVDLEAVVSTFSSRAQEPTGFERTTVSLGVRYRW